MKKIVAIVASAAVSVTTAGLMLAVGGVAVGAEPDNCADAVVALNEANIDHKAAVDADKAADDAEAADRDERLAREALEAAQKELDEAIAEDNENGATEDSDRTKAAKALVATRTAELNAAVVEANRTNADELRRTANETDVNDTASAREAAEDDFDRECTEGEDPTPVPTTPATPTPTTAPAPDVDVDVDVDVPSGGVDTGGGPA